MNLSDEIIKKYQEYIEYLNRDCIGCQKSCKGEEYGRNEVLFSKIEIIDTTISVPIFDPRQLRIDFGQEFNLSAKDLQDLANRNIYQIFYGECEHCNAKHIRCVCDETTATYNDELECQCGRKYIIEDDKIMIIKQP